MKVIAQMPNFMSIPEQVEVFFNHCAITHFKHDKIYWHLARGNMGPYLRISVFKYFLILKNILGLAEKVEKRNKHFL